ncbi:hypothetical protein [Cognatishimia sp.]|uniref:hypothetical protein n=1 Tax=Cognatishimia sp. TaxID=2211648 RepID=UPI003512B8F8|nr:hypothetical protein [Cognatishimia sp.]
MKEFTNEEKYTTLEQGNILEPIMDKLGIKADGFYKKRYGCRVVITKKYRLDTLLWVLPNWVTNSLCHLMCAVTSKEKLSEFNSEVPKVFCTSGCLHAHYVNLIQGIFILKGSKAIAAATELIKLLYDNNLLEVKND